MKTAIFAFITGIELIVYTSGGYLIDECWYIVVGGRWAIIAVLLLSTGGALPSVNFTVSGKALPSEDLITANSTFSLVIPADVGISGNKLQVSPVWNVSGVPYFYRKPLTISEPVGVARSNEKLVNVQLDINSGDARSDCTDFVLVDSNGAAVNYQRTSCSDNQIVFDAVVPSIPSSGNLEWWVYYGNPNDSAEKSVSVGGTYTATGSCAWSLYGGNHCSSGGSWCPGCDTVNSPQTCSFGGEGVALTQTSGCSTVCGSTGCRYCTDGISGFVGDSGNSATGTLSCSTCCSGGYTICYNQAYCSYTVQYSRYLASSFGGVETPTVNNVQVIQNIVPIFSHPNPGVFNLSLQNITSPSQHNISLTADAGEFWINSYVFLNRTGSIELNREFVGNDVLYTGELDPGVPNSQVTFTTPSSSNNMVSNLNFDFNSGTWSFENTQESNVLFNFTLLAHNIDLISLHAPELEFVSSGVPKSEYARACYSGTCYLQYNFSSFRDVLTLGVANEDELLLSEWSVDEPAGCSINGISNETESGICNIKFLSSSNTLTLTTENSTTWRAGKFTHVITPRTLNVSVSAPGAGTPGQALQFSGWANDSVTGVGVNGTVLAVLGGNSVQVNLTDGWFEGVITIPNAGSHKLRIVALDPPQEEQIWGSDERDLSVCYSNGNSCGLNWECCSGICCSGICSSTCNSGSSSNNNGGSYGGGWTPEIPQETKTSTLPELSTFLSLLAQARKISDDPYLDYLSLQVQQALLNSDTETINSIIQDLKNWIQRNSISSTPTDNQLKLEEPERLPDLELSDNEPLTVDPPPGSDDILTPKPNISLLILLFVVLFLFFTMSLKHVHYWS